MTHISISPELVESLQRLSHLIAKDDVSNTTLDTIVELAVGTLPGCDSAGVTVKLDGGPFTAAASDAYTLEIDKIQYDTDDGPCLEAMRTGEFREIRSVSNEQRWPEFCEQAASKGFGSNMSFPLTHEPARGALNIYAKSEEAFGDQERALGNIFASQAIIALKNVQTYEAAQALASQLNEALASRDVIGQAKGILMEREKVSEDKAFAMLVTISQNANVKLREVAERLVRENGTSYSFAPMGTEER